MRVIKLMPDYECYPLWEASPGEVGNIDPGQLPISSTLVAKLNAWARQFDETLNWEDPPSSGFKNEAEKSAFQQEGLDLSELLRNELGADYEIVYKFFW